MSNTFQVLQAVTVGGCILRNVLTRYGRHTWWRYKWRPVATWQPQRTITTRKL